jgi:hypothetical protein
MARNKLKRQIRKASKDGKVTKKELRQITKKTNASPGKINKALQAQADKGVQTPKKSKKIINTLRGSGGNDVRNSSSFIRSQVKDAIGSDGVLSEAELQSIAKNTPGVKAGEILRIANKVVDKKEGTIEGDKLKKTIKTGQIQSYLDKFAEGGIGAKELGKIFNKVGFKDSDKFFKRLDDFDVNLKPKAKKKFLRNLAKETGLSDLEQEAEETAADVNPFPATPGEDKSSKAFRKYKPQGGKIRKAAKAALDLALADKESFKPKKLKGTKKIKQDFRAGRRDRNTTIDDIEQKFKGTKPKFKDYKQNIKEIREGDSPYSYSGKFQTLGKTLGVEYSTGAREARTEKRFQRLTTGLRNTYETPAVTRKRRRDLGKQAIQSLKMN